MGRLFRLTLAFGFSAGFFALSLGALVWFSAGEIYDYTDSFKISQLSPQQAERIDVIVIPAGGRGRIRAAVEVWDRFRALRAPKVAPVLFLSGVGPSSGAGLWAEQGVAPELIVALSAHSASGGVVWEKVSENTFENAKLFASYAREREWKNVLLMTSSYHLRRAEFMFRKSLPVDVVVQTLTIEARDFDRNSWHNDVYAVRVTVLEWFKWIYYRASY